MTKALKRKWKFPKSHSNIVRKLLGMAKRGIHVTYLPGNHDVSHFGQNRLVKLPPGGSATTIIRGRGPGHEQGRGPRGIGALPIEIRG